MSTLYFLLTALLVLDMAACRWGVTSSDGINNKEWQRRQNWY
jgi:hypothetical protein